MGAAQRQREKGERMSLPTAGFMCPGRMMTTAAGYYNRSPPVNGTHSAATIAPGAPSYITQYADQGAKFPLGPPGAGIGMYPDFYPTCHTEGQYPGRVGGGVVCGSRVPFPLDESRFPLGWEALSNLGKSHLARGEPH